MKCFEGANGDHGGWWRGPFAGTRGGTGDIGTALDRLGAKVTDSTWGSADQTQPCGCSPQSGLGPGGALEMRRGPTEEWMV